MAWYGLSSLDLRNILTLLIKRRIIKDNGCWEFPTITSRGYSRVSYKKHRYIAHRIIAKICFGVELTDIYSTHICHKPDICNNSSCWNPSHIYVGNATTNQKDRWVSNKCKRGHEFTIENAYRRKDGSRTCRICCMAISSEGRRRRIARQKENILCQAG